MVQLRKNDVVSFGMSYPESRRFGQLAVVIAVIPDKEYPIVVRPVGGRNYNLLLCKPEELSLVSRALREAVRRKPLLMNGEKIRFRS